MGRDIKELLGPSGPEASCGRCFELVDRYVERESAGSDVEARFPGLRAHLEGCRACREEHESLRALVGAGCVARTSKTIGPTWTSA